MADLRNMVYSHFVSLNNGVTEFFILTPNSFLLCTSLFNGGIILGVCYKGVDRP